jgi:hypothetical protein
LEGWSLIEEGRRKAGWIESAVYIWLLIRLPVSVQKGFTPPSFPQSRTDEQPVEALHAL